MSNQTSSPSASIYQNWHYRPDIQGIRAIGAILIAIYHIWIHKVSGGVDVFFVMSGFLMTALLLKAHAREGRINPLAFWGKVIRRVAPSAYMILLITLIYGFFFAPRPLLENLVAEVIHSTLHLQNIRLLQTATDYLARDEPVSAVQQFWALSIQIQFYAVLPFALMAGLWLNKRMQSLKPLACIIAAIILLSFVYSVVITAAKPAQAYFNPGTRIWEFLAGSLLAILAPFVRISARQSQVLAAIGLVALVGTGVLVPIDIPFPGYIALLPVGAALLLLLSGINQHANAVTRLLSSRPLVSLGNVSFTIYLWHWPLLVFYQYHTDSLTVGLLPGAVIIALSISLAYFTTYVFEKPIKEIRFREPLTSFALGAMFLAPLMAAALFFRTDIKATQVERAEFWTDNTEMQATRAGIDLRNYGLSLNEDDLVAVKSMVPVVYETGCHQGIDEAEAITCDLGAPHAEQTIALVGGSHATQWLPALDMIGQEKAIRVINITKSACPFGALEASNESCRLWNENVIQKLAEIKPTMVVTNSTRSGPDGEDVPPEYVAQWRRVLDMGIPIIGIRDNPWYDFDVPTCQSMSENPATACTIERARALRAENPVEQLLEEIDGMYSVDLNDYMCDETTCFTAYGDYLFYRDSNHLSVPWVASLSRVMRIRLSKFYPEMFSN